MAIRAEAKNILRDIWPVVRTTEWLDVASFRICTCRCYESCAADLAGKIVQPLHPFAYLGVAHSARDC